MSHAIAPLEAELVADAARALSPETRRKYRAHWTRWDTWCTAHGHTLCPGRPAVLHAFLRELEAEGAPMSTIGQYLSAIAAVHDAAGEPSPTRAALVRRALRAMRRRIGSRPAKQARPIGPVELAALVQAAGSYAPTGRKPDPRAHLRDVALLLVGWCAALRRSELAALEVADLTWCEQGVTVIVRRSKTDQEGRGRLVAIAESSDPALCPVRALRAWLEAAGIREGRVFRALDPRSAAMPGGMWPCLTDRSVQRILERAVVAAGLEQHYSPHSMRAGFATTAAGRDVPERKIARTGGWRSMEVLRGYIRDGSVWTDAVRLL